MILGSMRVSMMAQSAPLASNRLLENLNPDR